MPEPALAEGIVAPKACHLPAQVAAMVRLALDLVPGPVDATGARLLTASRRFLLSPWWPQCLAAGWTIADVFGCDELRPLERSELLGLVPRVAIAPKAGRRLVAVTDAGATFLDPDGREIDFRRPSLDVAAARFAVCWWSSPALVNSEVAA
jgi:hypothetical protein